MSRLGRMIQKTILYAYSIGEAPVESASKLTSKPILSSDLGVLLTQASDPTGESIGSNILSSDGLFFDTQTSQNVGAAGIAFNEQASPGFDRVRNNVERTLLASAARTATTDGSDETNFNHRGGHFIINVTAYPAAASVVPKIQGKDPVSGIYYDILEGIPIVATGFTILKVFPGAAASANAIASDVLPRTFRIRMEHADADSITYSVGLALVV